MGGVAVPDHNPRQLFGPPVCLPLAPTGASQQVADLVEQEGGLVGVGETEEGAGDTDDAFPMEDMGIVSPGLLMVSVCQWAPHNRDLLHPFTVAPARTSHTAPL